MIDPSEVEIVGSWMVSDGEVHADETCRRIDKLTTNYLIRITNSPTWGDWETLYQDPADCRYWEKIYPQGEMHGGGPPCLRSLSASEARSKYGIT